MRTSIAALALAVPLGACGLAAEVPRDASSAPDTAPDAAACANHVPSPAAGDPDYGTVRGTSFQGYRLAECDGTVHDFYDEGFCRPSTRFSVVMIEAGWCRPSQVESGMLPGVQAVYEPRGVRFVQVLLQDESYDAPTGAFCSSWASRYALSEHPDESGRGTLVLIDPTQVTNRYIPQLTFPMALIVDDHGIIRFHEVVTNGDLMMITVELDRLLATP